jgi:microsomal dipeptidase-like Zn-dependent dipeptidase
VPGRLRALEEARAHDEGAAPAREIRDVPDEVLMSVDEWVDVVDYVIRLAGEDHVALGTDRDGARRRRAECGTRETSG